MYIKKPVLVIGAILLVLVTAFLAIGAVNPFGFTAFRDLLHFQYVSQILMDSYYEDIDPSLYMQNALEGMALATQDPYTSYLWGEEAADYTKELEGNYQGIGLYIENNVEDNTIEVVSAIAGSPAETAKISTGDKILKINGQSYTGQQLSEAASTMRGLAGTEVTVTILRKQDGATVDVVLTRQEIDIQTVTGTMITDDIGRINVTEFNEGTAEEFQEVFQNLKEKGMQKLVLDLRNNPGGLVDEAAEVLDFFLEEGKTMVYTLDRYDSKTDYIASGEAEEIPMVVLTNQGTASSSEIVTGCLKDYGIAYHIGEKTYGKGVVQSVYNTGGNSLLSVTIARYYTPKGVSIHEKGISPDKEVIMTLEQYKNLSDLSVEEDAQMQAALAYLKE